MLRPNSVVSCIHGFFFASYGILGILVVLTSCTPVDRSITRKKVLPPPQYSTYQHIPLIRGSAEMKTCKGPKPYKGGLIFRSRYEGSGHARDRVNPKAEQAYIHATVQCTQFEKFLATQTDAIIKGKTGGKTLECILTTLLSWAENSDLLGQTKNHTGKAVRKWTLAAISSNLLKIDAVASSYDANRYRRIKEWIAQLADQVVLDYSGLPPQKTNNHSYWAAWAVMSSAALLDRQDLFRWSQQIFIQAMNQIDDKGFLPNELRRRSRARLYHNYALTPLVGIAAFLQANDVNPFTFNNKGLARLATTVLRSLDDPDYFTQAAGAVQDEYDLKIKGRLSWLAIFSTLQHDALQTSLPELSLACEKFLPLKSHRLGGDMGFIYCTP